MPALLNAISDKSCFLLVKLSVWKDLLFDEGSKDVFLLFVGNVVVMYMVSNFVIDHVFNLIHNCCDSLALIDLKTFFNFDTRGGFESYCVDRIMES